MYQTEVGNESTNVVLCAHEAWSIAGKKENKNYIFTVLTMLQREDPGRMAQVPVQLQEWWESSLSPER